MATVTSSAIAVVWLVYSFAIRIYELLLIVSQLSALRYIKLVFCKTISSTLKPCPHCRRIRWLSQKMATVAENSTTVMVTENGAIFAGGRRFRRQSPKLATIVASCQCGQALSVKVLWICTHCDNILGGWSITGPWLFNIEKSMQNVSERQTEFTKFSCRILQILCAVPHNSHNTMSRSEIEIDSGLTYLEFILFFLFLYC